MKYIYIGLSDKMLISVHPFILKCSHVSDHKGWDKQRNQMDNIPEGDHGDQNKVGLLFSFICQKIISLLKDNRQSWYNTCISILKILWFLFQSDPSVTSPVNQGLVGRGHVGVNAQIPSLLSMPTRNHMDITTPPLPMVAPEVLRVAEHRHKKGLMYPYIYHVLTKVNF